MSRQHMFVLSVGLVCLGVAWGRAGPLVYEGFASSASGAGDDYEHDVTIRGTSDVRTGMTGSWGWVGTFADFVDFVVRDDNASYEDFRSGDSGVLELFRSGGTVSPGKELYRSLSYNAPEEADFYIVIAWSCDDALAYGIALDFDIWDTSFNIDQSGDFSTDFGGVSSDDYSGETVHTDGSWNLLVVRAIEDRDDSFDGTNPNPAYYDAFQLWLNPTISASGSTAVTRLGTPDRQGHAILRYQDGVATHFTELRVSSPVALGEQCRFDEFMITTDLDDFLVGTASVFVIR